MPIVSPGSISMTLQMQVGYTGFKAYARSKLAQIYFTQELAGRLDPNRITVNIVHPGHVDTNIWNFQTGGNPLYPLMTNIMRPFMVTAEKGAQGPIHLATAPELRGVSGAYFNGTRMAHAAGHCRNPVLQLQLWEETEHMVELVDELVSV
jgi:NAD(P)-dependent dehydrogenase (short-subunit alcohol dehydrogenase family)